MKLYIKQKVFSFNEKFTVKDEFGYDKYFVEGKLLSIPKQFVIYDTNGCVAATVEKKFFSIPQRYVVWSGGIVSAQIQKNVSFMKQSYTVIGPNWQIKGDFFAHEYTFIQGNTIAARVSKEWFAWGDSYVIEVADPSYALLVLAAVIAIDESMSDNNSS